MVLNDFLLSISKIDVYLLVIVNGIFTGLGVSIGSYLANTHLIEGIGKLHKQAKERRKQKGQKGQRIKWWLAFIIYACMFITLFLIIKFIIGK